MPSPVTHPHVGPTADQKIKILEDAVSSLQETVATLVFIANRDHPEMFPSEAQREDQLMSGMDDHSV